VEAIKFDGEGAMAVIANALRAIGVRVETSPGSHVPKAEALIKHIKSYCRGVINTLKWRLPAELVPDLVAYAVQRMNLLETKSGLVGTAPIVAFTGVPVDFQKEARFQFGQFLHCVRPNLKFKNDVF